MKMNNFLKMYRWGQEQACSNLRDPILYIICGNSRGKWIYLISKNIKTLFSLSVNFSQQMQLLCDPKIL